MRAKRTAPALLAVFSLLSLAACNDRLFDNPYDPNAEARAYELLSTLQAGGIAPLDLTFSGDALWAADGRARVVALNYTTGALIRELEVPQPAAGLAYDGVDLWLSVTNSSQLVLVNIVNGAQIRVLNLLRGSFGPIDYAAGRLYVADRLSNAVLVVDPQNGTIERSIPQPGYGIDGVCFDGASLWISDATQMKFYRLAPGGALENQYQAPSRSVSGLAFAAGFIWCGDRSGKIYKLRFP
jgi:outer membrane protein assembly factor BamB